MEPNINIMITFSKVLFLFLVLFPSLIYSQTQFQTGIGLVCDANFSPFSSDRRLGTELSFGINKPLSEKLVFNTDLFLTSIFKAYKDIVLTNNVDGGVNSQRISFQAIYFNLGIPVLMGYKISRFEFDAGPMLYINNLYIYRSKKLNEFDPEIILDNPTASIYSRTTLLGLGYCICLNYEYSRSVSQYLTFNSKIIGVPSNGYFNTISMGVKCYFSINKNSIQKQ